MGSHADNVTVNNCYAAAAFENSTGINGVIAGNSMTGKTGTIRAYGRIIDGVNICAPKNTAALAYFVYEPEGLAEEKMKSAEFADTLNFNIKEYGNSEWSEWACIKDGYPLPIYRPTAGHLKA